MIRIDTDTELMAMAIDRALTLAEINQRAGVAPTLGAVTTSAWEFFALLVAQEPHRHPVSITIKAGDPTVQGKAAPMQLHDNEQVVLTVSETDAKGVAISTDTLSWTSSDETIATVTVDPTTTYSATIVAGTVGSATITVSDGTLSATEAIDVIAGPVAAISIGEGTPVPQPAA